MEDTISTAELHHRLDKITIVDIRKNPDEEQIPGSIRYDGTALGHATSPPFERGQEVVVYCGSGNTCRRVAQDLRRRGIEARALDGGYSAWRQDGYETEPISPQREL